MRRFTWLLVFVLFSLITTACASGEAQPAAESTPGLASPSPTVALAGVAIATPILPTATPVAPTSAPVMETAIPLPVTPTPEPAPVMETVTSLPATPTPEPAPGSPSAVATDTPTPLPAPPAPAPPPIQVPAPKLVGFDGLTFSWEWDGLDMMGDEDWYFDIKIFYNIFTEYPYNVLVAEPENTRHADGVWSFDGAADFECGSFWAVQIAKRNPDGSYAGPLSPESNRLPVNQGCPGGEEDPCPGCG